MKECFFLLPNNPHSSHLPPLKKANLSLNRRVLWCDRENGQIKTDEVSVMSRAHCFESSPHVILLSKLRFRFGRIELNTAFSELNGEVQIVLCTTSLDHRISVLQTEVTCIIFLTSYIFFNSHVA